MEKRRVSVVYVCVTRIAQPNTQNTHIRMPIGCKQKIDFLFVIINQTSRFVKDLKEEEKEEGDDFVKLNERRF